MRKRHALLVIPAVVLLGLMAYVTGITGIFTVRGAPSPPFPQWIERTSSINPECNWGEALVVNWEVNPSHYNIQARGIDRQGNTIIRSNVPDICLGTEGMTCQFSETFPAQADLA